MKMENFENCYPKPFNAEEEIFYLEKMKQGDNQAKKDLILHNMRLVVHIAKKYYVLNENEDLISIGYFGLVKGLDSFDMDKNIKLSTYLGRCVENEILMYLRKIKKHERCISLETALAKDKEGDALKLMDILADESNTNFQNMLNRVLNREQIAKLLKCLNEMELKIVELRFGLKDGVILSQKEIGEMLGFSRSYISRLERNAIKKLQEELICIEEFYTKNSNNF